MTATADIAIDEGAQSTEISIGGKPAWVFRRLIKGERSDNFYVLGNPPGRPKFVRSTGFSTRGEAVAKAKVLWRAELNRHLAGVAEALDQTKLRRTVIVATIGELIAAHEAAERAGRLEIKGSVARGYRSALRRLVAWARGLHATMEGGDRERIDEEAVDRLSASILTEELVQEFELAYIASAGGDHLARDRRRRGVEAVLRNARAFFEDRRVFKGLVLPELTGFQAARYKKGPKVKHDHLPDSAVAEMAHAALELRATEPALYLVHLLQRQLGLRNDEILEARREWIERLPVPSRVELPGSETERVTLLDGSTREIPVPRARLVPAVMAIRRRAYWVPKQSEGRVSIAACVLAEIKALPGWDGEDLDFLIPARTKTERWELIYVRHADFVRPWTAHLQKRGYELRRWAATKVRLLHQSREMGDVFLRHAGKSVADAHYFTELPLTAPLTLADALGV